MQRRCGRQRDKNNAVQVQTAPLTRVHCFIIGQAAASKGQNRASASKQAPRSARPACVGPGQRRRRRCHSEHMHPAAAQQSTRMDVAHACRCAQEHPTQSLTAEIEKAAARTRTHQRKRPPNSKTTWHTQRTPRGAGCSAGSAWHRLAGTHQQVSTCRAARRRAQQSARRHKPTCKLHMITPLLARVCTCRCGRTRAAGAGLSCTHTSNVQRRASPYALRGPLDCMNAAAATRGLRTCRFFRPRQQRQSCSRWLPPQGDAHTLHTRACCGRCSATGQTTICSAPKHSREREEGNADQRIKSRTRAHELRRLLCKHVTRGSPASLHAC